MFVLYAFISSIVLTLLSYPYYKAYQLGGYVMKNYFRDMFSCFQFGGKNRLVLTKRMLRFIFAFLLICMAIYIPIYYSIKSAWIIVLDNLVGVIVLPIILIIAHMIMYFPERWIKGIYILKTAKKLKNFNGIKIGITGSFGKTSTKNILKHLLEEDFVTIASPKNYNTPMGVCLTVKSKLNGNVQVAIFEMGARYRGDIKELMEIVDPNYCLMTSIGEQHLETMGDIEGVKSIKYEMCKYKSQQGCIIFNGKSEATLELYNRYPGHKFLTGNEGDFCYASDIEFSKEGGVFWLHIDGEKAKVRTKLLGKYNIENIVLASSLAYLMGVKIEKIVTRISSLEPTKNRLELLEGEISVLDDSYNSNFLGATEALEIGKEIGNRLIVVTPGFVELGNLQYEKNFIFGKKIGMLADVVIVMNSTNRKALDDGLNISGFGGERYYALTREEQKEIIKNIVRKGDLVLFENDLPDNYR